MSKNPWRYPLTAAENRLKYAKAPTWEMIDAFLKETEMQRNNFERFYGIPHGHLKVVRHGSCNLSAAYWHIFYEKIKPAYGMGFAADMYKENRNAIKFKKANKKSYSGKEQKQPFSHDRLNDLK